MAQVDPQSYQQGRPGYPPNFQPPANMPNINFAAPVIRLGAADRSGPGGPQDRDRGGRRAGLGSGPDYRGDRERPQPIQPQTKEEIIRTLFVGGITEGCGGDEGIERILRAPGGLRRWFRATDAEDKPCKFGFAEYEDAESLSTAIEVLKDIYVPVKQRAPDSTDDTEVEKSRLLIVADENSRTYIEQYEESQGGVDTNHKQMLIDQAQDALRAVLADLENPQARPKEQPSALDPDGDISMSDESKQNGDVLTIQLSADDELADIPAEMRETVAREIAAFRDRSNRRDLERLKREEEIEQQEKSRMMNGSRSRLGSPPATAPSGPNSSSIPSGPRGAAPTGPKGQASGFPKDYVRGVTFVNGTGVSAASAFDDDTDASDEDLERRRQEKIQAESEKDYLDQERRWLNRERSRNAAVEREKNRDDEEASRKDAAKEIMAKRLKEWIDDEQAAKKDDEYYRDKSLWTRNRIAFRQREAAHDDADRAAEQREQARDQTQRERAGQMADDFLSRQGDILSQPYETEPSTPTDTIRREPARFKMSLGAAAQQRQAANQAAKDTQRRPVADVEGMLEDEEGDSTQDRRKLIPIPASQLEAAKAQAQDMTDEERAEAAKNLAAEIPNDKSALWAWNVQWSYLDSDVIEERLRPFVEKKIVDILGVQEEMLVDVVVTALNNKRRPEELAKELEGALDEEEADSLVRKLWRMVVFMSESGRRGLGA
ncbi:hypothetical protein LTR64_001613 [Lithohypha guttulata]|uniref:uncharacterized protein n=1 Tax=Lithohypha guttulata TaxID=1690604 RepID=UPI002DDEEEC1|nr:hypothetical protein LTR51_003806 [Lithohypha guttulata]